MAAAVPDEELFLIQNFPHRVEVVDPDSNIDLFHRYTGDRTELVRVGEHKVLFPKKYCYNALDLYTFEPRSDDIIIMGFPCSGMLDVSWWLLHYFQMDYKKPSELPLGRIPLLEANAMITDGVMDSSSSSAGGTLCMQSAADSLRFLNETMGRRIYRTHLPFDLLNPSLLQKGCKIIYVARNPKDVIVSMYDVHRKRRHFNGDLKSFMDLFLGDNVIYTPYFKHVEQAWTKRNENNLLIVCYNDIMKDLAAGFTKILAFLHTPKSSRVLAQVNTLLNLYSKVKNNLQEKYYQAQIDDELVAQNLDVWSQHMDSSMIRKIDPWLAGNIGSTGINLPSFL